jgi:thiamine biosynthesis lipoprotein
MRSRAIKTRPSIVLIFLFVFVLQSCQKETMEPISDSQLLLGTSCFITIYSIDKTHDPEEALNRGFKTIEEMENRLSVNIYESEISSLNRLKNASLSPDTLQIIKDSLEIASLSEGRFDPSIGALVSLWGIGTDSQRVPSPQEITQALASVDYTAIDLNENKISLPMDMMIDLGGIAKGRAADLVKNELKSNGVTSAIINLGGNVQLIGGKPDGSSWRIGIQNPEDLRGQYIGILETKDSAVVTSGIYERYFIQDGVHYHHILDTETGYPVDNGIQSLTVIAKNSLLADGLSTALFSLGREKAMDYAENHPDIDIIVIDDQNRVYLSSHIKDDFRLTNTEDFSYTP